MVGADGDFPGVSRSVALAHEGSHGEARARELGLERIAAASSQHERWWGGLDRLVVEIAYGNGFDGPVTYVGR